MSTKFRPELAVFDWTIPREWNIRDAYIKNDKGEKIVDFCQVESARHELQRAGATRACRSASSRQHIYTLPDQPDLIPYRTSYYAENWAFCMAHRQYESLRDETYEVVIDSSLTDGPSHLRRVFPQRRDGRRIPAVRPRLPSLAGERQLLGYRAPDPSREANVRPADTVQLPISVRAGHDRRDHLACPQRKPRLAHQARAGCLDGRRRRRADLQEEPARKCAHRPRHDRTSLRHSGLSPTILDFSPYGYDERQYCSPGFNLPVGLFQRSQFGTIPQYHTSADNLDFIRPEHLRRLLPADRCGNRRDRKGRDLSQHSAEMRAAARKARPLWRDRRRTRTQPPPTWRCFGCSICRTERIRCSTSPSVRICPSTLVHRTAELLRTHGLLEPLPTKAHQAPR